MPTYEYACDKCGHRFETVQSIMAPPLKRCPKCRRGIRRVIHGGAALVFKGSGFYSTDYRDKGEGSKSATEEKASEGSDSSDGESSASRKD